MPRTTGNSFKRASPRIPASVAPAPAPVLVPAAGFLSNMWQGFGLGAGQAIAHNIFRSDPVIKHVHASSLETSLPAEFVQCMKDSNDKEKCKHYLDS